MSFFTPLKKQLLASPIMTALVIAGLSTASLFALDQLVRSQYPESRPIYLEGVAFLALFVVIFGALGTYVTIATANYQGDPASTFSKLDLRSAHLLGDNLRQIPRESRTRLLTYLVELDTRLLSLGLINPDAEFLSADYFRRAVSLADPMISIVKVANLFLKNSAMLSELERFKVYSVLTQELSSNEEEVDVTKIRYIYFTVMSRLAINLKNSLLRDLCVQHVYNVCQASDEYVVGKSDTLLPRFASTLENKALFLRIEGRLIKLTGVDGQEYGAFRRRLNIDNLQGVELVQATSRLINLIIIGERDNG